MEVMMDNQLFKKWMGDSQTSREMGLVIYDLLLCLSDADANSLMKFATMGVPWKPARFAKMLRSKGLDTTKLDDMLGISVAVVEPVVQPHYIRSEPMGDSKENSPYVPRLGNFLRDKREKEAAQKRRGINMPKVDFGMLKDLFKKKDAVVSNEENDEDPEPKKRGFALPGNKKLLLGTGIGILVLILGVVGFWTFGMRGGYSAPAAESYDFGAVDVPPSAEVNVPQTQAAVPDSQASSQTVPSSGQADQEFWFGLRAVDVPELSPGNLDGQLNAKTVIGIVLMIILTVFAYFEGRGRNNGQQGSLFFSMAGVLAGWLAMPLMVYMATASAGMFWLSSLVLIGLWVTAATTIKSQSDLSPFTVALAVFTASLFYVGKLSVLTSIGALFGLTWPTLVGVTTIGGALTLLMTGRASQAILTLIVFFLGVLVIYLASREVGKKHGKWAPFVIGFFIIVLFMSINWGLNSGVAWLVANQNIPIMVEVVLRILAPLFAWLMSLLGSVLIGARLGDVEVGFRENRQKLGLEKSGTFIENMSDFLILGTIVPLFLGVIIIFL